MSAMTLKRAAQMVMEKAHEENASFFQDVLRQGALQLKYQQTSCGTDEDSVFKFLRTVPHLYTVHPAHFRELTLLRREFGPMDVVLDVGQQVQHLFVVIQGQVEVFGPSRVGSKRVGTIPSPNVFGFDSIIFNEPAEFLYRAGPQRTCLILIPAREAMKLLQDNPPLRQSIGRKMAEQMDLFIVFKEFCRQVFAHGQASNKQYLDLLGILKSYENLQNCIHPMLKDHRLDYSAWMYGIRRLPDNITNTFCIDLARSLPPFVASRMKSLAAGHVPKNAKDISFIKTRDRRRCAWQLGIEGKMLVLLREGFTDMLDFITCLCIHITEAEKLRNRLQGMVSPPVVDVLDSILHTEQEVEETPELQHQVMSQLPLSPDEIAGLQKIWPTDVLHRMYDIIMHREEYLIRVDSSLARRYDTDPYHEWALNLRAAVLGQLDMDPQCALPDGIVIDVLSSNTHSTKNCVSPFARRHREEVLAYGRKEKPDVVARAWHNQEDLVYSLLPGFLQANPQYKEEWNRLLSESGITVIVDTALTGLQVDVIHVSKIDMEMVDPLLRMKGGTSNSALHFILNMDFAFGAQADGITRALILTFGKRIRSFSIMGKGGGLLGSRGDIQLATHVLYSKSALATEDAVDEMRHCDNRDVTAERLSSLSNRSVHVGPVLTIPGTMLQNKKLLHYYRTIWQCVGVEMEGTYFARQIIESKRVGLISKDCTMRFAYYTSDLPLNVSSDTNLALPMRLDEGVPPLYAITRAMLENMLHC